MQLQINDLNVEIPTKNLFTISALTVQAGEKIGFVAANGSGKTTFFELLNQANQHGSKKIKLNAVVGYLPQKKITQDLSGGEEVKAELVTLLRAEPDMLLLDEPSANLDNDNQLWLENSLQKTAKTVIFSSHDRALLNKVAQKIWYLERGELKEFVGNYDTFVTFRQDQRQKETTLYESEQREKARLEAEVEKRKIAAARLVKNSGKISAAQWKMMSYMGSFDGQAKAMAKAAKSLEKRLDKEFTREKPEQKNRVKIATVGNLKLRPITLLRVQNKTIARDGCTLFSVDDFKVTYGDHLVLTGANGSGKTTFLEYLREVATAEIAESDTYRYAELSIGVFEQKLNQFNEEAPLLSELTKESMQSPQTIRNLLGTFGFHDKEVLKKIGELSGGEKVRFALAQVLLGNHHLLLLDEPSNYLDIDTMQALENFLVNYPGTFVLVSHDEALTKRVGKMHWLIEENKLVRAGQKTLTLTQKERQEQLDLLIFQKDQLMLAEDFDLEKLRALTAQITALQKK